MGGVSYLLSGIKLLSKKGIRGYVIVPLLINVVLFALIIAFAAQQLNGWVEALTAWLPAWLDFLGGVMWLLFALLVLVVLIFGFTLLANLIAAPFNAFLSAAVQRHITGEGPPDSGRSLFGEVIHSIRRELAKLIYYLPRALLLLLVSLFPLTTALAPLLWLLFGGWMMALQYVDYPMDNNGVGFKDMRLRIAEKRFTSLGFGFAVMFMAFIPLLNLVLMPAAVAGATRYWVEENQTT